MSGIFHLIEVQKESDNFFFYEKCIFCLCSRFLVTLCHSFPIVVCQEFHGESLWVKGA